MALANDTMSEGPGKGSKLEGRSGHLRLPLWVSIQRGHHPSGVGMSNGRHSSRRPSLVKMTICLTSDPMECTNHARAEALGSSLYTGPGISFIVKSR